MSADVNSKPSLQPLLCLLVVLAFIGFSTADSSGTYEEHYINISATSVAQLIDVSTDLNISYLIPYHEYNSTIKVKWAIPDSALKDIGSDESVLIFVEISTTNDTKSVYFRENDTLLTNTVFVLECKIINMTCGEGSVLEKSIPFNIMADSMGTNLNDVLLLRASLVPLPEFEKLKDNFSSLNKTVADMVQELETLNVSDADKAQVNNTIKEVEGDLSLFDIKQAGEKVSELNTTLGSLKEKSDLTTSINTLENEVKNKTNLTSEESSVTTDILSLLNDAKDSVDKGKFSDANFTINLAENKFGTLNDMISERMKTFFLFRKNLLYVFAFCLALLLLVLSLVLKPRTAGKMTIALFSLILVVSGLLDLEQTVGEGTYLFFATLELALLILLVYPFFKSGDSKLKGNKFSI